MKERNRRPDGASDEMVAASGKVTEAYEWIQRARGRLYDFHQMIGHADLVLEEAVGMLGKGGETELADLLRREIIGRNVLDGRWTYQVVEEFDSMYFEPVAEAEKKIRYQLVQGRHHVFEAEMKERRRTHGRRGHESDPPRHVEEP